MPLSQDKPPPSGTYSLTCPPGYRLVGQDCFPEVTSGGMPTSAGAGTLGQEAAAYAVGGKPADDDPLIIVGTTTTETVETSQPLPSTKPFPWLLLALVAAGAVLAARAR
jgi:hypothetical protein